MHSAKGLTLPNGILAAYTYDGDSRVKATTWTLGNNRVGDLEYSYDADGRVIGKTGSFAQTNLPQAVTGNMFNADNEMTAFNGTTLSYDANGNLTNDGTNTVLRPANPPILRSTSCRLTGSAGEQTSSGRGRIDDGSLPGERRFEARERKAILGGEVKCLGKGRISYANCWTELVVPIRL